MPFIVPSREELLLEASALFLGLQPKLGVSGDEVPGAILRVVADLTRGVHSNAESGALDIHPSTAMDDATLEKHAERHLGPNPWRPATTSSGASALRVTGALAGAAVTAGLPLVHADGTRYELTEGATVGAGTADLSLRSLSTGEQVNKSTGEKLDFESPPPGIAQEAELVVDLGGGRDRETPGELLARLLHALRNPPAGGRLGDYWMWAMAVSDVAGAYVYGPHSAALTGRRGLGVVDVAVVATGSGAARIPGDDLVEAVQGAIDAARPATTSGSSALKPTAVTQSVDVRLTPGRGYEWDWTGAGVVQSWNAVSKRLTWTGALPASFTTAIDAAGSARLYVAGQVLTATAYGAGGGNDCDVQETPATAPANPDPIYPGGPLSQVAADAIKAYMDRLGPARGDKVGQPNAADPNQSAWDDTLRLSKLYATLVHREYADGTASGLQGCQDAEIVTPGANVTPDDNAPADVELLVYGQITVRPA